MILMAVRAKDLIIYAVLMELCSSCLVLTTKTSAIIHCNSSCSLRRGGGLSSRLDYIAVKRGSIAAASDDSQNADDSVDGEEDATK